MLIGAHLAMDGKTIEQTIARGEKLGFNAIALCIASPISLNNRPNPNSFAYQNTKLDVTIHAPYIINPASISKKGVAKKVLFNEIMSAERLGAKRIVIHPGSANDCSRDEAISNIREVLCEMPDIVDICVEMMAGKGNEMCGSLEEMALVVRDLPNHIGVCLDTCHLHDAGYDLTNTVEFLNRIQATVGFNRIKIIHVNGSLNKCGSKKDRHAALQDKYNQIPVPAIRALVQNIPVTDLPVILEIFKTDETAVNDLTLLKKKSRR